MFNKLAYSAVALTVSLGTVMSCQAEATGKDYASAFNQVKQINAGDLNVGYVDIGPKEGNGSVAVIIVISLAPARQAPHQRTSARGMQFAP